eukprot:CAMPEP_0118974630 /NCGR_PEP_ID=MMETSP1173-20130426/12445_1 /TAXON_ID=1034831 /ORGANISM="Rhizochromulina marina cf, Strain CCMP1243" /LENGTH=56 /DNA_ID=CAMNT_0006924401 /DNA_START=359 /DNA_END=526 /DNA_ORIENTATION=+
MIHAVLQGFNIKCPWQKQTSEAASQADAHQEWNEPQEVSEGHRDGRVLLVRQLVHV